MDIMTGDFDESDLCAQSMSLKFFAESKAASCKEIKKSVDSDSTTNSRKREAFGLPESIYHTSSNAACATRGRYDYLKRTELDFSEETSNFASQFVRSSSMKRNKVIVIDEDDDNDNDDDNFASQFVRSSSMKRNEVIVIDEDDDDDDEIRIVLPFPPPQQSFFSDFENSCQDNWTSSRNIASTVERKGNATANDHAVLFDDNTMENPDSQATAFKLIDTRRKMELFCSSLLRQCHCDKVSKQNSLFHMINLLETVGVIGRQLASSMHEVRILGNKAAHNIDNLPNKDCIDRAILNYKTLRKMFCDDQLRL
jgi:Domain of unknown function (DUF4145)